MRAASWILGMLLAAPAPQPTTWQKVFGWDKQSGTRTQDFEGVVFPQADGGVVILSLSEVGDGGPNIKAGHALAKLDATGKLVWHRWTGLYGSYVRGHQAIQTRDGGFLAAGHCGLWGCFTKWDSQGKQVWHREYEFPNGTTTPDYFFEHPNGDIQVYFDGAVDHWMRLDASGNSLADQEVSPNLEGLTLHRTLRTPDGGFLAIGTNHPGTPDGATEAQRKAIDEAVDLVVVKFNGEWQEAWRKSYGGPKAENESWLTATPDGGYVIAGGTESYGRKGIGGYLVKIDQEGNKLWERVFGSHAYTWAMQVHALQDGTLLVTGNTGLGDDETKAFLKALDAKGQPLWEKSYPCGYANNLGFASDGGYYLYGHSVGKCGANWIDLYLIKTDAQGNAPARR